MTSPFLQRLRAQQQLSADTGGQRLYYRLRPGAGAPRLALAVARAQPNGQLDGLQPYRLQAAHLQQPPLFLAAADVELLRQLSDRDPAWWQHAEATLPAGTPASWLQALVATGRLRGPSGETLHWGDGLNCSPTWTVDSQGRQRLDWRRPPGVHSLPASPPCYWDTLHGRLGPLAAELPAAALAWLERSPRLAAEEVDDFRQAHSADFAQWGLPLPRQLASVEMAPAPQPQLRLSSDGGDRLRLRFAYHVHGDTLWFEAGAVEASARHYSAERGELVTVQRDAPAEAALNISLEQALAEYAPQPLEPGEFELGRRDAWREVMTELLPALKQRGWQIEVASGFRHHYVRPERLQLATSWQDRDWFELALNVELDGESLSLLPLLAEAAQHYSPEQLQRMPAGAELPLQLSDGRRLLVPAARLAHWLTVLVELSSEGAAAPSLRLPAAQLQRLGALHSDDLDSGGDTAALLERARELQQPPSLDSFSLPDNFGASLRDYQRLGVAWLQQRRALGVGGILADDMGLGKTVQTLAHLAVEHAAGRLQQPALVVAPTSLLHNWQQEAERFAPQLRCRLLHGPARHQHWEQLGNCDLLLTSYALVVRDSQQWQRQPLSVVILDEAQTIKNARSQVSRQVRHLDAHYRLCLTGTPLENHLGELWSQFEFLMPGFFDSEAQFQRQYRRPIEVEGDRARAQGLMERIAPFMLRRTKEDVASDLPPKTEVLVRLPLQGAQRDLYEMLRQHSAAQLEQQLATQDDNSGRVLILNALLQLRQACCDPQLVDPKAQRDTPSAKREHLLSMLAELVEEGRAVLVFSQFTRMLDLIGADLEAQGIPYLQLTGRSRNRAELVAQFQAGAAPVFLISLKAGGTGLNLTRADTVIHYDPWWNSAAQAQATDRAYRIGQDKPVFVYKLLAEDSVEEKIHALQLHKRGLLEQVYQVAEANTEQLTLDNAALLALLDDNKG